MKKFLKNLYIIILSMVIIGLILFAIDYTRVKKDKNPIFYKVFIDNIKIPESILTYCYSSKENVKVTINELTKGSITITIVDTNEIPYKYNNSYSLYKKVKNKNYTGVGEKIGKDTENSTSGFTRNRK